MEAVSFRVTSRDRRLELPSFPHDGNESLRGFFPRFPPSHPEDVHVKFILKTRPRSKPTVGEGSGGSRGTVAIKPAPKVRALRALSCTAE